MRFALRTLGTLMTAAALACSAVAHNAYAAYPDKPVKVVVGFAPGGTNDILARLISQKLQEKLKQSFIVENKPGANSIIAAEYTANAPADGYTIFVASSGALTVNPALYSTLRYSPLKDFEPVALLGSFPLVVAAGSSTPASNINELKSLAKKTPDNSLNHGVATSSFQLAAELFAHDAGINFTHVNYKGSGPTIAALLGGEIQVAFLDIGAVMSQVKAGKIKALAVSTARRSTVLPEVPTIAESGVSGYDVPIWTGLVVPKGTPDDVKARLHDALKEILAEKDFSAKLATYGMEPGYADPSAFRKQIESDLAKWSATAKRANIKIN